MVSGKMLVRLAVPTLALVAFACVNSPPSRPTSSLAERTPEESFRRVAPPLMIPGPVPPPVRSAKPVDAAGAQTAPTWIAQAPPVSSRSTTAAPAPDPLAELRRLHRQAAERFAGMDSYIARLRRREQVGGRKHPEEVMLFKFRKQPWSVSFKFLGPEGKDREVVFVKGRYGDKIHTLTAAGDIPFTPAGSHIAIAPDNFLVRSASRYPITDAGIGNVIDRFGQLLAAVEGGNYRGGSLRCLGRQQRNEFPEPVEAVEQVIAPGTEPPMPKGGKRLWFFDPRTRLPLLVIAYDPPARRSQASEGQEVEYYCYDRLQAPVKLDEDDFNPEKMGQPRP